MTVAAFRNRTDVARLIDQAGFNRGTSDVESDVVHKRLNIAGLLRKMAIITISHLTGSGGREIATATAQALKFQLIDRTAMSDVIDQQFPVRTEQMSRLKKDRKVFDEMMRSAMAEVAATHNVRRSRQRRPVSLRESCGRSSCADRRSASIPDRPRHAAC